MPTAVATPRKPLASGTKLRAPAAAGGAAPYTPTKVPALAVPKAVPTLAPPQSTPIATPGAAAPLPFKTTIAATPPQSTPIGTPGAALPAGAATTGTGGASTGGYAPLTGYAAASGYTPDLLDTIINQHPELMTGQLLRGQGRANTAYAGQLADEAGTAQLVAYILSNQPGGGTGSNNDIYNAMAQYYQNRITPGGSLTDTRALVQDILNAGADPNSQIYNTLGIGSASGAGSSRAGGTGQVDTVANNANNMILGALNDQNRYTQQATKNYLAQKQSDYMSGLAQGQNPGYNYLKYLNAQGVLGNWFGQ